jgi:hypothetical protein
MKLQQILRATGLAMVLGAATVWAQNNGTAAQATTKATANGILPASTKGVPIVVSVSTNGGTANSSVSVNTAAVDPATGLPAPGSEDDIMRQVNEEMRRAIEKNLGNPRQIQEAIERATERMQNAWSGAGNGGFTGSGPASSRSWSYAHGSQSGGSVSAPAVITTSAMAPGTRGEWAEDLQVMDKLLSDEIGRVEGDATRQALGIPLMFSGGESQAPMYLEGYGALFSYSTDIVLATAGKKPEKKESTNSASSWNNTRRRLGTDTYYNGQEWTRPFRRAEYDAARLEALTDSVVKTLREAKNIRQLRDDECVTITLAGRDEAGEAVRLTLKARKGDIINFADEKMTAEEFKQKVARSIG